MLSTSYKTSYRSSIAGQYGRRPTSARPELLQSLLVPERILPLISDLFWATRSKANLARLDDELETRIYRLGRLRRL